MTTPILEGTNSQKGIDCASGEASRTNHRRAFSLIISAHIQLVSPIRLEYDIPYSGRRVHVVPSSSASACAGELPADPAPERFPIPPDKHIGMYGQLARLTIRFGGSRTHAIVNTAG
jgi:hypothetical protein